MLSASWPAKDIIARTLFLLLLRGTFLARLPPSTEAVLVTHVEDIDELERLLQESEITTVQLHSEIAPSSVERLRGRLPHLKIFKSINIISADSVAYPEAFEKLVDGFVLDSVNLATGQVGGTGKTHDWSVSRQIVMRYPESSDHPRWRTEF